MKPKLCARCKISKLESKIEREKNCCLLCGLEMVLYGNDNGVQWPTIVASK